MNRRLYQEAALREFVGAENRFWALLWERQAGKSTTMADFALYEMMQHQNRTVVYASASLLLAQEITLKTAVRANQTIAQWMESDAALLKRFADTAQSTIDAQGQVPVPPNPLSCVAEFLTNLPHFKHHKGDAKRGRRKELWPKRGDTAGSSAALWASAEGDSPLEFKTYDASTDKEIIGGRGAYAKRISAASFAELFSQQRLEFRVYYSATSYSRTKVIAPNIATARSWSGTVLLDEVAFIRNLRELMTALLPVITTDKQFKLILATIPPEFDDTHHSFELLAPPAGMEFTPRAEGSWSAYLCNPLWLRRRNVASFLLVLF